MEKIRLITLMLLAVLSGACSLKDAPEGDLRVIPYPQKVALTGKMRPLKSLSAVRTSIDTSMGPEAYRIEVGSTGVKVVGGGPAGVDYGLVTLQQEMDNYGGYVLCGTIEDSPRYEWRGFMLDEARHFFGKEKVKSLLDDMARYKMNRFHWHLTDAQGWRIEIKSRPELTRVGAAICHSNPDTVAMFYTQEDIMEIVAYAAERHIEIIPEIDVPGHVSAATKSYPEINGGGTVGGWPGFTLDIAAPQTYAFLKDVIGEVSELFPFEYIHIGGDEVSYGSYAWLSNPRVVEFMKTWGYDDVLQAEAHFIRDVAAIAAGCGKKVMGWNDVQSFGLDAETTLIHWWRHNRPDQLRECLDAGFGTVLCPRNPLYFDYVQDSTHTQGAKWPLDGGFSPLEDIYAFPDGWTEKWNFRADEIIGLQANLWTEKVHNSRRFDFMVYPRICALAESCWSAREVKDWDGFRSRLQFEMTRLEAAGKACCDGMRPEPPVPVVKNPEWPEIQMLEK